MEDDLNSLWPLLLGRCPKARLGLSKGKPAVYNLGPGLWPFTGESWGQVLRKALGYVNREGRSEADMYDNI